MLSWPAPHVPAIPGSGHALRLFDPAVGQPMTAGGPGRASLFVCGFTPDDAAHLGHTAAAVAFDVVVRAWRDAGLRVAYVQAIHGADDDAAHEDLAAYLLDMTSLGVIPPDHLVAVADGTPAACAAIAAERLGADVDVLGGSRELVGAHHQAVSSHLGALTGSERPAHRLVHVGLVRAEGAATGPRTQVGVADLGEQGVPPMAVRLLLLDHPYRSDREHTRQAVERAVARLERWTAAVSGNGGPAVDAMVEEVRAAIADDLDTPRALRAVDAWADAALSYGEPAGLTDADVVEGAPGVAARAVDALLGVRL